MRTSLSAAIPLFVLAACGAKPTPATTAPDATVSPVAAAAEEPLLANGSDRITAIDAADGDGRAMPADSFAPSAYDLAQRAERAEDVAAQRDARAQPAAPVRLGAPADLVGADESVTAGD